MTRTTDLPATLTEYLSRLGAVPTLVLPAKMGYSRFLNTAENDAYTALTTGSMPR